MTDETRPGANETNGRKKVVMSHQIPFADLEGRELSDEEMEESFEEIKRLGSRKGEEEPERKIKTKGKKKRERDLARLNAEAQAGITGAEEVGDLEVEEREEKINYLATNLTDDLVAFYDNGNINGKESAKRLERFGVKTIYMIPNVDGVAEIDYKFGKFFASKMQEYFLLQTGNPREWFVVSPLLKALGLEKSELEEAREMRNKNGTLVGLEKKPEMTEAEKREEKINYLANNLVEDLKVFYGPRDLDKSEARDRLRKFGVQAIIGAGGKTNFTLGRLLVDKMGEFLTMERGVPDKWRMIKNGLAPIGLDETDLQEARKKRHQSKENSFQEKSFEERLKQMEASGGHQVTEFLNDLKTNGHSEKTNKMEEELTRSLGFDVGTFATEWRKRKTAEEKGESLVNGLKNLVGADKLAEIEKTLSVLGKEEVDALRAVVYLLNNPSERGKHPRFWTVEARPILKFLGIDVL